MATILLKSLIPLTLCENIVIGDRPWLLPNYDGEHVVSAAWELPDGKIFTGLSHAGAFNVALRNGAASQLPNEISKETLQKAGWKDGFFTNKNRWISRKEAADMEMNGASKGKLLPGDIGAELQSHMVDYARQGFPIRINK